jgi:diaminohydroxyphosphoribosylaminopyrimidine deaminase/5-amino-6-(5-phosphoribosylamino)uracil reductase
VSGKGFAELRAAGIDVTIGTLEEDAVRLNRPFITVQTHGRPMVIAKAAMSVDGRIAAAPGMRTQLTSRAANLRAQRLRAEVDAVAVGSGTVLADDPLLTVRDLYRGRPLARVVFDRRLRIPATARLFSTLDAGPVIIVTTAAAASGQPDKADGLTRTGAKLVYGTGALPDDLRRLVPLGISAVLLEGGATMHAAAWRAGVIDSVQLIGSPRVLGEAGVKVFDGVDVPASALRPVSIEILAPDVWMEADVYRDR